MSPERCFACSARLTRPESVFLSDKFSYGWQYEVHVGPECFKHVKAVGVTGYQPPKAGPRLFLIADDAARVRA